MDDKLDSLKPTERFSDRVDNYAKYRPSYPGEVISFLEMETGLQKDWNIADIGSGTGIFSALLLEQGYKVYGVEPNKQMREAGEKNLMKYSKFTSVDGTAERTSLKDRSIDLITIAQAFHWMKPAEARLEFKRLLKPPGYIVLIWNIRITNTPFLERFEQLKIDFGTDYKGTRMVKESEIGSFFEPPPYKYHVIPHSQVLDFDGLKGQLLSTSYMPLEGRKFDEMLIVLKGLFEQYQENGLVKVDYETKIYLKG